MAAVPQPVYYLGPEGTFSHIVARRIFGKAAKLVPKPALEAVVEAVADEPGSRGILPIENSSGGTVYDSIDALIRHAESVQVLAEVELAVRIALLGKRDSPIRAVYSHFTQIKHHAEWLAANAPGAALRAVPSTALAAKRAAGGRGAAAMASPGAAEIYGLEILAHPPRERVENVTHFFALGHRTADAPKMTSGPQKTALVVALPNTCGSLHAFLGPFARLRVNLTRIVSRPVRGKPKTYVFFVEVEGGSDDPAVARALRRAAPLTELLTSLGTFPSARRLKS